MATKVEERISKQDTCIAVINTKLEGLEEDLNQIKTNHLPHIQSKLDSLGEKSESRFNNIEKKIAYWIGGTAAIGFALQIVLRIISK
jgi:hypothetical protein